MGGVHGSFTAVVTSAAGSPNGTVAVEGSQDGSHWVELGSFVYSPGSSIKNVMIDVGLMRYVRGSVSTNSGSLAITLTVAAE
jgi:hypothetical protein